MTGDEVIATASWEDEKSMLALRDRLNQEDGTSLNVDGAQYILEGDNRMLLRAATQPGQPDAYLIGMSTFVTDYAMRLMSGVLVLVASLWPAAKQVGVRGKVHVTIPLTIPIEVGKEAGV